MIDCHTHCEHSADCDTPARVMIRRAIELGMQYYAITDHLDRDILYAGEWSDRYREWTQIDIPNHIAEITKIKAEYKDELYLALGIECSYSKAAVADNIAILGSSDEWDIILNSVHTVDGIDCYFPEFFTQDKHDTYTKYLTAIYESVNAPYSYDVIGHIGYACRKAPYQDPIIHYHEFPDLIDAIFNSMIDKDVSLEINSKGIGDGFLPSEELIKRYIELGGENFTFGSDAHRPNRVGEHYGIITDYLKNLGAKYYTVYKKRKAIKLPL